MKVKHNLFVVEPDSKYTKIESGIIFSFNHPDGNSIIFNFWLAGDGQGFKLDRYFST